MLVHVIKYFDLNSKLLITILMFFNLVRQDLNIKSKSMILASMFLVVNINLLFLILF